MDIISEEYLELQKKLHENPHYGTSSPQYASRINAIIKQLGVHEVLDYGCGKAQLGELLQTEDWPLWVSMYDPAIEEFSEAPSPNQFIVCTDVLEHIEPEYLDNVLNHIKDCMINFGFIAVHCGPAKKFLEDGRNAHLIQENPQWWLNKLWEKFNIITFSLEENGFYCVVRNED